MSDTKYSSLVFVSENVQKYQEYCNLLGNSNLRRSDIRIHETQDVNIETLVREKIDRVKNQIVGAPFFVEHTGLIIDAWRELPGGLTRIFMDTVGNKGICKMMRSYRGSERKATARIVIGYFERDSGIHVFHGDVSGIIAPEPRGSHNFGWDPIFIPEGSDKTYGQMTLEEKNRSSMRREAVDRFKRYLDTHLER